MGPYTECFQIQFDVLSHKFNKEVMFAHRSRCRGGPRGRKCTVYEFSMEFSHLAFILLYIVYSAVGRVFF